MFKKLMSLSFVILLFSPVTQATMEGVAITTIPYTINTPGMYHLTGNLTQTNRYAKTIVITADNVTLDLNGYTIYGMAGGNGAGIEITSSNIEVRNGTVTGFRNIYGGSGISGSNTSGSGIKIHNIRATDNSGGGIGLSGTGHIVTNCVATGNGTGISAHYSIVKNNVASNNTYNGIVASHSTVTNNTASDNGRNGFNNVDASSVVGNTANRNGRIGILGHRSSIHSNSVTRSGTNGIHGHQSNIIKNTVTNSTGVGILSGGGVIKENAVSSAAIGIETSHPNSTGTQVIGNHVILSDIGINVGGYKNIVESNSVISASQGIYFESGANFYKDNKAFDGFFGNLPSGAGDGGGNISSTN